MRNGGVTSVDRKRIRQDNRTRRYIEALIFSELSNKPIIINSSFMYLPDVYSLSSSVSTTTKISIKKVCKRLDKQSLNTWRKQARCWISSSLFGVSKRYKKLKDPVAS